MEEHRKCVVLLYKHKKNMYYYNTNVFEKNLFSFRKEVHPVFAYMELIYIKKQNDRKTKDKKMRVINVFCLRYEFIPVNGQCEALIYLPLTGVKQYI